MKATLLAGPFEGSNREVDELPPDVLLATDDGDPTLEHLYRLRSVDRTGADPVAVYEYAPEPEVNGP